VLPYQDRMLWGICGERNRRRRLEEQVRIGEALLERWQGIGIFQYGAGTAAVKKTASDSQCHEVNKKATLGLPRKI